MKKKLALILVLFAVVLFTCSCGTVDGNLSGSVFTEDGIGKYITGAYLKINTIDGECQESKHERWIEVIDFDFGVTNIDKNTPAEYGPFVFVHKVDAATPNIQKGCALGTLIGSVTFEKTVNMSGRQIVVFSISLEDTRIISSEITCDAQGNIVETVKFDYLKATVSSTSLKSDGSVGGTVSVTLDNREG